MKTISIPCRQCGKCFSTFTPKEGTHEVVCPGCGQTTIVKADLLADEWRIKTEGTSSKEKLPIVETAPSLQSTLELPLLKIGSKRNGGRTHAMARRKLSERRKKALRSEMLRLRSAGSPAPKIIASIAKKYGIGKVMARWYLTHLGSEPAVRLAQKDRKGSTVRGGEALSVGNQVTDTLSEVVENWNERALKRAVKARKLLPTLKARRARVDQLGLEMRKAQEELDSVQRQFDRLLGAR